MREHRADRITSTTTEIIACIALPGYKATDLDHGHPPGCPLSGLLGLGGRRRLPSLHQVTKLFVVTLGQRHGETPKCFCCQLVVVAFPYFLGGER